MLIDVNVVENRGGTAIGLYNSYGANNKEEIIKILKEAGATTDFITDVSLGDIDSVRNYIDNGADVNSRDHLKRTILMVASYYGHLEVVKYLIDKGAEIDTTGSFEQTHTALLTASQEGWLEVVKYLISKGANLHIISQHNETALILAVIKNHFEVVKYLVENGSNINAKKYTNRTPLMIVSYHELTYIVNLLKSIQ